MDIASFYVISDLTMLNAIVRHTIVIVYIIPGILKNVLINSQPLSGVLEPPLPGIVDIDDWEAVWLNLALPDDLS